MDSTSLLDCGDVRSRTSYNNVPYLDTFLKRIAVTFDLGRVTTLAHLF